MIHRVAVASIDELLNTVGCFVCEIVRFDVSNEVAISYLFDGDERSPRTCQWRVTAPAGDQLEATVQQLLTALSKRGIRTTELSFSETICQFSDFGPW